MNTVEWIILFLAAILGIGYLLGAAANRQRMESAVLRLQAELHESGTISKLKSSGTRSIGFRLLPKSGRVQFIDFTITLEARDHLLPVWAWQHLRGVRDQISIQANTLPAPNFDIRVFPDLDLKNLREMEKAGKPFKKLQEVKGFNVYVRGVGAPSSHDALPNFIANFADALLLLAIQSTPFNITLRMKLESMQKQSYLVLYQSLQEIIK